MASTVLTEKLFDAREIPWHQIGKAVGHAPTSEAAIMIAELDWEVVKEPAARITGEKVGKTFLNVRQDTGKVLGVVSDRYKIVQNIDAFRFTDNLIGTGEVRYEFAGQIDGGREVWLLAKLPDYRIIGDTIAPYLCYSHGHDGKTPIRVVLTPIRVASKSALSIALKTAKRQWTAKHLGDIEKKLGKASVALGLAYNYLGDLNHLAENLYDKKLSRDDVDELIVELRPMPKKVGTRKKNNVLGERREISYRHDFAPDLKQYRNTGWGFILAVSDFVTNTDSRRHSNTYEVKRFKNILDNNTLLGDALKLVESI